MINENDIKTDTAEKIETKVVETKEIITESKFPTLECGHCHLELPAKRNIFVQHFFEFSECGYYVQEKQKEINRNVSAQEEFYKLLGEKIRDEKTDPETRFLFSLIAAETAKKPNMIIKKLVSDRIMETEKIVSTPFEDIFYYEDGIYIDRGKSKIDKTYEQSLKNADISILSNNHTASEVVGQIRRTKMKMNPEEEVPLNLLCIKNGILNVDTREVMPHSPDYFFISKIPIEFNKDAKCPKFDKFLSQVLPEEEKRKLVQELFGYCLRREYRFERAFMFVGKPDSGKSTVINMLTKMIGENNCEHISLDQLIEDQYMRANLYGKFVNSHADIDKKDIEQTGIFKVLTGKDGMTVERKYGKKITFTNYAKLIFSCNDLPKIRNDDRGFFKRWIITKFTNVIDKSHMNLDIEDEMTTPEELSGILNFALAGLERLLKNKSFTGDMSVEKKRDLYIEISDSVKSFIEDECELAPLAAITKGCIYDEYKIFCNEKNYPSAESHVKFSERLAEDFHLNDCWLTVNGEPHKAWKGLTMKKYVIVLGSDEIDIEDEYEKH